MTRIRRAAVLLGTAAAVLFGSMLPADARFADTAAVSTAVRTADVAPGDVDAHGSQCNASVDVTTGTRSATLQADVSWTPSSAPGVTGYVVTARVDNVTEHLMAQVDAGTTSLVGSYDISSGKNVHIDVIAQTSYGWTGESASGVIKC
jgi:hypothetical protein